MTRKKHTNKGKYKTFKKAFDTFEYYLNGKNYIGAYVLAFSILEDRLNASYSLLHDHMQITEPPGFTPFKKKLKFILNNQYIKQKEYKRITKFVKERNKKIHAAMWNLHEFTEEDCKNIIPLIRQLDKISKKIKKALKEY